MAVPLYYFQMLECYLSCVDILLRQTGIHLIYNISRENYLLVIRTVPFISGISRQIIMNKL